MMKKAKDVKIPFPVPPFAFGGIISGTTGFDPLGSYTGRTPERNEITVQDADDL